MTINFECHTVVEEEPIVIIADFCPSFLLTKLADCDQFQL